MFHFTLYHKLLQYFDEKGFSLLIDEYEQYLENTYDNKRGKMNFIDMFLDYTKEAESPTAFFRWSAIAAISATLRDNVYMIGNAGRRVYPNLYIILVARSGACRKGYPLKVTEGLLNKIKNTKIISGRTSIQAVVKILAENATQSTPTGAGSYILSGASGLLYSEELASLLVDDKATIPILTDLYDYHEDWANTLKASDTERLKHVCLSLLAASNETFLKDVYQSTAIYGGLLARTVIVMANSRRQKNAGVRVSQEPDPKPLLAHLRKIASTKGRIIYDDKAADLYEEWYNKLPDSYESKSGIEARYHTTVQKISICLAMAEPECELVVKERHVLEAINLCEGILKNYEFMTMHASANGNSSNLMANQILRELLEAKNHQMTRSGMLRKHLGELDSITLDKILNTMIQGEIVQMTIIPGSNDVGYQLTQKYFDLRKQITEGK